MTTAPASLLAPYSVPCGPRRITTLSTPTSPMSSSSRYGTSSTYTTVRLTMKGLDSIPRMLKNVPPICPSVATCTLGASAPRSRTEVTRASCSARRSSTVTDAGVSCRVSPVLLAWTTMRSRSTASCAWAGDNATKTAVATRENFSVCIFRFQLSCLGLPAEARQLTKIGTVLPRPQGGFRDDFAAHVHCRPAIS